MSSPTSPLAGADDRLDDTSTRLLHGLDSRPIAPRFPQRPTCQQSTASTTDNGLTLPAKRGPCLSFFPQGHRPTDSLAHEPRPDWSFSVYYSQTFPPPPNPAGPYVVLHPHSLLLPSNLYAQGNCHYYFRLIPSRPLGSKPTSRAPGEYFLFDITRSFSWITRSPYPRLSFTINLENYW